MLKTKFVKNEPKEDIKFFEAKDSLGRPTQNAYIIIDGDMYRVRGELLVFNDENQLFAIKKNEKTQYGIYCSLPGGSAEPGKGIGEQAVTEAMEEAEVIVKNTEYSGMRIVKKYEKYPKWQQENLWPLGYKYEGHVTFVFTAKYVSRTKGAVGHNPWDHQDAKLYNWYNPDELGLDKERLIVIDRYIKNN